MEDSFLHGEARSALKINPLYLPSDTVRPRRAEQITRKLGFLKEQNELFADPIRSKQTRDRDLLAADLLQRREGRRSTDPIPASRVGQGELWPCSRATNRAGRSSSKKRGRGREKGVLVLVLVTRSLRLLHQVLQNWRIQQRDGRVIIEQIIEILPCSELLLGEFLWRLPPRALGFLVLTPGSSLVLFVVPDEINILLNRCRVACLSCL